MIEAVNSTIAASVVSRANVEQQSAARAAAEIEPVQQVVRAPFVSPYISVDTNFDRAVLQIRDSETGDVVNQFPSQNQLEAYQRAQAAQIRAESLAEPGPDPQAQEAAAPSAPEPGANIVQVEAQQQISAPVTEAVSVDTQA